MTFTTNVLRISTGELHAVYSCNAREAVIAAYAQDRKDSSTWEYEKRYGDKVKQTKHGYTLGDFWAKS